MNTFGALSFVHLSTQGVSSHNPTLPSLIMLKQSHRSAHSQAYNARQNFYRFPPLYKHLTDKPGRSLFSDNDAEIHPTLKKREFNF